MSCHQPVSRPQRASRPGRVPRPAARGLRAVGAILVAGVLSAPAVRADRTSRPSDIEADVRYATTERCVDCHEHEERGKWFRYSTHGRTGMMDHQGVTGCESCHGEGIAHARSKGRSGDIILLEELSPEEQAEKCMECHDRSEHRNWWGSVHEQRGLSCLSCHQIHHDGPPPDGLLKEKTEFDTCRSCHLRRIAGLLRSSHMPLREQSMTCTSCHAAHGSVGPAMLRQFSVNENCYQCHAEKRSPMLWEHSPVKEDCTLCHDAHGSLHQNLLNAKMPRLCQQCHDEGRHPTEIYQSAQPDRFFPRRRMFNHACVNCHSAVHGSNHPSGVRLMR